jgi:DNA-directed RNA polymerase subunit RPC12/RpoP
MKKIDCLRCGVPMKFLMRESFQKGECGAWVGNLNFSFRGGYEMEVYRCPKCGKLEFFEPDWQAEESAECPEIMEGTQIDYDREITRVNRDGVPQVRCRACGKEHDFDYPACPYCGQQSYM